MPRTGRGGKRQGSIGATYSNRTDLNAAPSPMQTVPGQEYGKQADQMAAMHVAPMSGPQPSASPQSAPQAPQSAAPPTPQANPAAAQVVPWDAPTQRPNEPITAGLDVGPGPGSEALQMNQNHQAAFVAQLNALANTPGASPEIQQMANIAARLGL